MDWMDFALIVAGALAVLAGILVVQAGVRSGWLLIICGGSLVLSIGVASRAPYGWEDESGFHYGRKGE